MANPKVLFSKLIGKMNTGRVMRELFADVTPKTTESFRALCTAEKGVSGKPLHHYRSNFHQVIPGFKCHQVIPGFMSQGEVFARGYASGGEATYAQKLKDENLKHTGPGIRSVANAGRSSSASEFEEIMADYVHQEMTRTWILVLMRLFLIIAIKDVFVSLVCSD